MATEPTALLAGLVIVASFSGGLAAAFFKHAVSRSKHLPLAAFDDRYMTKDICSEHMRDVANELSKIKVVLERVETKVDIIKRNGRPS